MSHFLRGLAKTGLCIAPVITGGALVERIVDPFERHEHDYTLEGPSGKSEVFYMSSNYYEAGERHNDRVGDAFIITTLGIIMVRGLQKSERAPDSAQNVDSGVLADEIQ